MSWFYICIHGRFSLFYNNILCGLMISLFLVVPAPRVQGTEFLVAPAPKRQRAWYLTGTPAQKGLKIFVLFWEIVLFYKEVKCSFLKKRMFFFVTSEVIGLRILQFTKP